MTNPFAEIENICAVDGCVKPSLKKGLCNAHYLRQWRHGSPTAGGTSTGAPLKWLEDVAYVYDGDECLTWPFSRTAQGYGDLRVNGEHKLAHRMVCEVEHGPPPSDRHEAAHSCGKGHLGCVTKKHLRWATHQQNHDDRRLHGTCGFAVWRRWKEQGLR